LCPLERKGGDLFVPCRSPLVIGTPHTQPSSATTEVAGHPAVIGMPSMVGGSAVASTRKVTNQRPGDITPSAAGFRTVAKRPASAA
jgi:hypothetical protein